VATANWTEDDGDFSVTGEIVAKLTDAPCIAANARLIAAAPCMLAALEGVVAGWYAKDDWAFEAIHKAVIDATAAIAKAKGGVA
jgi:hypothetical protein